MGKFFQQQFISIRSAMSIISWLYFSMIVVVLSVLIYFLSSLDQLSAKELHERVSLALVNENRQELAILVEYTYWDEAYNGTFFDDEKVWADENVGSYLFETYGIDFSLALGKDNQVKFFASSETEPEIQASDILGKEINQLVLLSNELESKTQVASTYLRIGDAIYLVVGGPFIEEDNGDIRPDTFLLFGRKIDSEYLEGLTKNYQLQALELLINTVSKPSQSSLNLNSPLETLASVRWTPKVPSKDVLPSIVMVLSLFLLGTIIVSRYILTLEQANREAYENKIFFEATRDPLTQIHNRKYFMEMARKEFSVSKRYHRPFCVLMIDIDHFKNINDSYGHSFGDSALMHMADICSNVLREHDLFGRLGGEEFAVVLPNTSYEKSLQVAERVRQELMESPFAKDAKTIKMTVSIGMAELSKHEAIELLIEHADKAMYLAKSRGRNRVECYGE
ncbi:diguanylate cyclase [Alginatibacterium sediminis]|uniref:diguanylate cyclase n=1 Tax=Alginatibacterium sediminis TaxID=2164068 RepID=A0A420EB58_9ALTE|nr:diguanylate cyclase [Alginatibacterium sediminis]RKF17929.1 diguanylate cyclase [Alginatibacterium sediminis]